MSIRHSVLRSVAVMSSSCNIVFSHSTPIMCSLLRPDGSGNSELTQRRSLSKHLSPSSMLNRVCSNRTEQITIDKHMTNGRTQPNEKVSCEQNQSIVNIHCLQMRFSVEKRPWRVVRGRFSCLANLRPRKFAMKYAQKRMFKIQSKCEHRLLNRISG